MRYARFLFRGFIDARVARIFLYQYSKENNALRAEKERIELRLEYVLNNGKKTRAGRSPIEDFYRRTGKSYESILKLLAETFGVQLTTTIRGYKNLRRRAHSVRAAR